MAGTAAQAEARLLFHCGPGAGISHSVRDLVQCAFDHVGLDWEKYVHTDKSFIRPAEVDHLLGDSTKANTVLKWKTKVDFAGLIHMMVDADLERLSNSESNKK